MLLNQIIYFDPTTTTEDIINTVILGLDNNGIDQNNHDNNSLKKQLKFIHINVRSIFNKLNLVELLSVNHDPDILCFTETWLNEQNLDACKLSNYDLLTQMSRNNNAHGGSAIFVKQNMPAIIKPLRYISNLAIENVIECCGISIDKKTCLICIYRPPCNNRDINSLFFNQFNQLLDTINRKFEIIFICGDLNINELIHNELLNNLNDLLESHALHSLINEPTRIQKYSENSTATITSIDYFITNNLDIIKYTENFNPGLSDHLAQMVVANIEPLKKSQNTKSLTRNFSMKNIIKFKLHLKENFNLKKPHYNIGIETLFRLFYNEFMWSFYIIFPLKNTCKPNKHIKNITFSPEVQSLYNEYKAIDLLIKINGNNDLATTHKIKKK